MKNKRLYRAAAALLAVGMTAALAGCGSTAEVESTAESANTAATAETATAETAVDESAYDYLADFDYSAGFDENGYLKDVTAADYVTLPDDYADITLDAALGEVSDEDVTAFIEQNFLSNFATTEQVTDRAAEDGDTVNIDYVGTVDGVEFDGGSTQGQGTNLTLGSGAYIPGFEEQIVGHTPGETFDVNVTFPEDYTEELAGKDAVFETTLNYINETVMPELTDEWVQENLSESTAFTSAADLNAYGERQVSFNNQCNDVYAALRDKATFSETLPESAVNYYRDSFLYEIYSMAHNYGVNMVDVAQGNGYETVDAFVDAAGSLIEAQVKQQLLLQAVAEKTGFQCDTDTLNAEFSHYSGMDPEPWIALYGENYNKNQLLTTIVMQNLIDQVQYQ